MAWLVFGLDGTLVEKDEMTGEEFPVDGAIEALTQLANEGHRLTVHTERFAPMPEKMRNQLKEEIEESLAAMGFPQVEVWTGYTKPAADLFFDTKAVTFDHDWGLALAQAQVMMEDMGLVPGPMPDDGSMPMDGEEEMPVEGEEPPPEEEG